MFNALFHKVIQNDSGVLNKLIFFKFKKQMTQQRNLTVRWFGWNDTGSGIKEYRYTIYAMELDNNGLLIDGDTPVREEKIWESGQETPRFFFDVPGLQYRKLNIYWHCVNVKELSVFNFLLRSCLLYT